MKILAMLHILELIPIPCDNFIVITNTEAHVKSKKRKNLRMLPFPPVRTAPAIFFSLSTFICKTKVT